MAGRLYAADSLLGRLVEACRSDWQGYVRHAFVEGLGDGRLPPEAFRRYLVQDYLFLKQFCRAYGLAVFKSAELDEMRRFTATLDAILNREIQLHVACARDWGLSERALADTAEADATVAYTRFVIDCGLAGDLLDLAVALAPCVVGYAEIAEDLAARAAPATPYRVWIDAYAGPDYRQVATDAVAQLDRLGERRGGNARFAELARTFGLATRLEASFWQMGLQG